MSGKSNQDAARDQDQMEDQRPFREDPRGRQQVSEQQPETQADDAGQDRPPANREEEQTGETGRDDSGQATGNPPNAG